MSRLIPPIVVAALLAVPACQSRHEGEAQHEEHHTLVATNPKVRDVTITQRYVCQIHSRRHIGIRSLEGGYLEPIHVKEGQAVKKGDLLFKILPTLFKAKLDAEVAEAQLAQLEVNYTQQLVDQKVVSANELALQQAKLAKAKAKVTLAQAELAFTDVRAPFDGIVDRLHEQDGSLVKEGDILTTLSDNSVMWVYFNVPEARYLEHMANLQRASKSNEANSDAEDADENESEKPIPVTDLPAAVSTLVTTNYPKCIITKAEVETDGTKTTYELEIVTVDGKKLEVEISPDGKLLEVEVEADDNTQSEQQIDLVLADGRKYTHTGLIAAIEAKFNHETGNIPFRADFPNPDRLLRHGQTGNVLIHHTLKNAMVIPQRATFEILDKRYVWVIGDDNVVHQRPIVILHEQEDIFVIGGGLSVKDKIILEGVRQVHEGQHVEYEVQSADKALSHQKFHAE